MADNKFAKILEKLGQPRADYVTDPYDQQSMYEDIAKSSEVMTPEDVAGLAGIESGHGKYTKPFAGGSASGSFQLMPNTIKYLRDRLSNQGSTKESNPLREQARLMSALVPQHEAELKKTLGSDVEPEPLDIFIKHNLGAGMGKKLLKAKGTTPVEDILPEDVVESNPSIYKGKTKTAALSEIQKRLDTKGKEFKFEDRSPLGFLKDNE